MSKKSKNKSNQNKLLAWGKTLAGRVLEKNGRTEPLPERRKPVIETLEQRLLLSASPLPQPSFHTTMSYSALPTGALDATLEIVDTGGPHLSLQLRSGGTVLASETLDENLRVAFTGSAFNDRLTVKLDGNSTPYAIRIDFDGGTDVPVASDDQLILDGSDAKGLFIQSSDDVQIKGALQISGDLDVQSAERIEVAEGASIDGQDIRLAALDEAKAGLLGSEIRAVADAQVSLLGATLTGRNISIDAEAKVALDSKDSELFGKQLKLGIVDAKAAAAIALVGNNQIHASGSLALDASAKVDTKLASAPDDSSKNTAKDAAVAITHIDSSAQVRLAGSSALSAGGALSVAANNAVTAKTTADGSAGTAAGEAKGAVLAASYIHGDTRAELADSASLSGSAISLSANATRSAEVLARATKGGAEKSTDGANDSEKTLAEQEAKTSDGSLQFAAAVAVGAISGQSQVLLGTSGALTATEAIAINAGMAISGPAGGLSTSADGANKEASGSGVGVAVAINTAKAGSQVLLGGSSLLSAAGGVNVTATSSSAQFGAQATSGASATGLGVAGSLALNAGVLKAEALVVAGAAITVSEGTTLSLKAETRTSDTAKANAKTTAGGEQEGAGASVAINVADSVALAAVEAGAQVDGAGSLKLDAQSNNSLLTEAKGGAEGGTAITPVAAISLAHHDTLAELRGEQSLALQDLSLNAKHEGQADTLAEGAASGSSSGLGMAFASAFVLDNTRAVMDRALVLGGALDLSASGKQGTSTTAKSSVKGGKGADKAAEGDVDKEKAAQREAADEVAADKGARDSSDAGTAPKAAAPTGNGDAEGSDNSALSTAGVLAVNLASSRVDAGIAGGRLVSAAGAVTIKAQAEAHSAAIADGTVTLAGDAAADDQGVGVAIALNAGRVEAHAYMAGQLTSAGLALTAGTPDEAKNTSQAVATAGAGGGKLGAAGALAINAGTAKTSATLDHAARLNLGDAALSIKAQSSSEHSAEARPKEVSGKKTGIGAAVAFNLADESTTARIQGGATVSGAAGVTVAADSKNQIKTEAEGGAAGSTAFVPSIAVTLATLDTTAEVSGSGSLAASGDLAISASHAGAATTTASGKADGAGEEGDTAVGVSLAIGVVRDNTRAAFDRRATLGGQAEISASSQQSGVSTATASAKGGKPAEEGKTDAKGADKQKDAALAAADQAASEAGQRGKSEAPDAATPPKAETPDKDGDGEGTSSVSVAGAIAVNVADSRSEAYLGGELNAAEAVALKALSDIDGSALADASATVAAPAPEGEDSNWGVGVAVALNVGDVDTLAVVAGVVGSKGLSATAGMLGEEGQHSFSASSLSGAGGGNIGVAGSLAVNVGGSNTTAGLNDTARLNMVGDGAVKLEARSSSDNKAEAKPKDAGAAGSKTGFGASVAINVVDETTQALAEGQPSCRAPATSRSAANSKSAITTEAEGGAEAKGKDGTSVTPVVAVTVANLDTLAEARGEGSLAGSGALNIAASHAGEAKTSAKGKSTGEDSAVGISVAVGIVEDRTGASLAREAGMGGKAAISAQSSQESTTTAAASSKGGKVKKPETDEKAVDKAKDGARSAADKVAADTGKRDSAEAGATPKAAVADKDGKAEGKSALSVAGAVAVNLSVSHTEASVSGRLSAGDAVAVSALADIDAAALADGSAVVAKPKSGDKDEDSWGVGVAVAINVGEVENRALVSGEVTAKSLAVTAGMAGTEDEPGKHVFSAKSTSGASGGDVGVAGSVAINVGAARTEALLGGEAIVSQTGADGAVKLSAKSSSENWTEAKPKAEADGKKTGVGASASINVVDETTRAAIQEQAAVMAEGDIALTADAKRSIKTTAEGGAKSTGSGGDAVVPVAAVTVAHLDTVAEVTGSGALKAGGDLSLAAKHSGSATTTATGNATADETAFGAAVAVSVVSDTTRALLDRDAEAGGAISLSASSKQASEANATASAKGGKQKDETVDPKGVDNQKDGQRKAADELAAERGQRDSADAPKKGRAEVAGIDSSGTSKPEALAVAGAIAVNVADTDTLATTGADRKLKAGKTLSLKAQADTDAKAIADGSAVARGEGTDAGVGVAVAINVAEVKNRALIGAGNEIEAKGLKLQATTGAPAEGEEAAPEMGFEARAKSGAGSDKVGVAGSVAINIANAESIAAVDGSARITLKGGDLGVTAHQNTRSEAVAEPKDKGVEAGTTGVGASVALNVIDTETTARIADGAAITGEAADVSIAATGRHEVTTVAKNGAAAGKSGSGAGTGVGAAVALAIVDHDKTAELGSGEALTATGKLEIKAQHSHQAATTSNADGAGGEAGVGANVAVNLLDDRVLARAARSVTAAGDIAVTSEALVSSSIQARASAQGAAPDAKKADEESANQVKNNPNIDAEDQAEVPKAQDGVDEANAEADKEASFETADIGVAAVVGVTSLKLRNEAVVAAGAALKSVGGDVKLGASSDADATNQVRGSAIDMLTDSNVGVAVAVTVAEVQGRAEVGEGARLEGRKVAVTAGIPDGGSADFRTTAAASAGGKEEGVGGSVAVAVLHVKSEAKVAAGAALQASENLRVEAKNRIGQQTLAAGGAIGQDKGVGVAGAITVLDQDTLATVGDNASLDAAGATTVHADAALNPLLASLDPKDDIFLVPQTQAISSGAAGAGASAGDLGVGGSVVVNVIDGVTEASLGQGVKVNHQVVSAPAEQSVSLLASDHSRLVSAAGALSGAFGDGVAVAAGVDVGVFNKRTTARVGNNADINARSAIRIEAQSREDITSVAAAAGLSSSVAVGASVSVYVMDTATEALTGSDVSLNGGRIDVRASGELEAEQIAGQLALGSDAGVGLANTTLVHKDRVEAQLGARAELRASAAAGLTVEAASSEQLLGIAAAGAGSATAGVAGSAVVNILNETTRAGIADGARINATAVQVLAEADTEMLDVAGSVSFGGTAGIGAGAGVTQLTKNTEASLGSGVVADIAGNLRVQALSSEELLAVSAAGGGGGTAGVAGAAGILVADVTVRAFVGDDPLDGQASAGAGHVHARGSVAITADDDLDVTNIAGSIAIGGSAAIGASVGVPVVTKKIEAFVGDGAKLTADGHGAIDAATGRLVESFSDGAGQVGAAADIKNGNRPQAEDLRFSPKDIGSLDLGNDGPQGDVGGDPLLKQLRDTALAAEAVSGLAISATNRDSVKNLVLSGAGSGAASVSAAAGVNVFDTTVRAAIGNNASVNADTSTAAAGQRVQVGASSDFYHLEIGGSLAVSGAAGVAPAVGVTSLNLNTQAQIGSGASVNARDDVVVQAHAEENLVLISAGIGGGTAGIGGAVTVPMITTATQAVVGANASLMAGGDVGLLASDDSQLMVVSGAIGAGAAGIGASVGVLNLDKNTAALVGSGAQIDALGWGQALPEAGDSHGLLVQAESKEDITHLAIAAGLGAVGIAGGVSISLIDADTQAVVGQGALINQRRQDEAAEGQDVRVRASDQVDTLSFAGALGGGTVGLAGAVDVGSIRNDTSAVVRSGARIAARDDVTVDASQQSDNQGFAISAGAGVVGFAGSVSVWSLGTKLSADFQDSRGVRENGFENDKGERMDTRAADQLGAQGSQLGGLLASYQPGDTGDGRNTANERLAQIGGQAGASVVGKSATASGIKNLLASTEPSPGTAAQVEAGAEIQAGDAITVKAEDRSEADFTVGSGAIGMVGVGGSVGVLNVAHNAQATVAGVLSAGGAISINGELKEQIDQTGIAAGGGIVGIGAAVSIINDSSTAGALLADGAVVRQAASLTVQAKADQTVLGATAGAAIGAVPVGASFARINLGNAAATDVRAAIGNNSRIGQDGAVGAIKVDAHSRIDAELDVAALAGGIGAFTYNSAEISAKPDVRASIGDGGKISNSGNLDVVASSAQTVAQARHKPAGAASRAPTARLIWPVFGPCRHAVPQR